VRKSKRVAVKGLSIIIDCLPVAFSVGREQCRGSVEPERRSVVQRRSGGRWFSAGAGLVQRRIGWSVVRLSGQATDPTARRCRASTCRACLIVGWPTAPTMDGRARLGLASEVATGLHVGRTLMTSPVFGTRSTRTDAPGAGPPESPVSAAGMRVAGMRVAGGQLAGTRWS
jgi:hypothetical protein